MMTSRKTKIIKAIIATQNESILDLLEEDLNLSAGSDFFDVETNLTSKDIQELKKDIEEGVAGDALSENEFWTLVNSWDKK